jgi:hypothetical protein
MKPSAHRTSRLLTALAVVVAVLAVGNPGLDEFANYASRQIEQAPGALGFFAGLLPGLTRSYLLSNTQRSNFGVFSIYRIDPGDSRSVAVLGIAWHFLPLGRSLAAPADDARPSGASEPQGRSSGI